MAALNIAQITRFIKVKQHAEFGMVGKACQPDAGLALSAR